MFGVMDSRRHVGSIRGYADLAATRVRMVSRETWEHAARVHVGFRCRFPDQT